MALGHVWISGRSRVVLTLEVGGALRLWLKTTLIDSPAGIMTGSFYSISTLLNQMIIAHYEVMCCRLKA